MITPELRNFKWISIAEAVSFLVLVLIAMPLKYAFDWPPAVKYVGWAHGLLFILYIIFGAIAASVHRWTIVQIFWAMMASLIPMGPFVFHKWIEKQPK